MIHLALFVVSLGVLVWGADRLIGQAETIAQHFGLSDFFIGATLIALGTSLPEMAASVSATIHGHPAIALANIIGSNILNITLVLGIVFLIARNINPHRDFFAQDSSWALFPVFIFILMIVDGVLSRFDGVLLLALMGAYLIFLMRNGSEILPEAHGEGSEQTEPFRWGRSIGWLAVGFAAVIFGADYLIESAEALARMAGVSEWIIGILMIALGTSLPELVVSIVAARQGKADMAIGNIIGSNMANISVALGAAAIARPLPLDPLAYAFDIGTMLVATLMLVLLSANKLYTPAAGIALLIVLALFLTHTVGMVSG